MLNRTNSKLFLIMAALLLLPYVSYAKTYELTFQSLHPTTNVVNVVFAEWIKQVEEKSKGQLKISLVANASITGTQKSYEGLRDGAIDMGTFSTSPETMPYAASPALPFLARDAVHATKIAWHLMDNLPKLKDSLKTVKVLSLFCSGHNAFLTTKTAIKTLADFKNKRVIIWGGENTAEEVKAWGGNPTLMAYTDTYIGLQRGMGDIVYMSLPGARPMKLQEVAKHVSALYISAGTLYFGINNDVWNELPKELQDILIETSGVDLGMDISKKLHAISLSDVDDFNKDGVNAFFLSDEEIKPFMDATLNGSPMEYWKKTFKKAGVPDPEAWIKEVYDTAARIQ